MTNEIKDCPFCKDEVDEAQVVGIFYEHPEECVRYSVICECGASGAEDTSHEEAIAAWNTRAAPYLNGEG